MPESQKKRLMLTALGKMAADLVITGGTLIDVYTQRVIPRRSIALCGPSIAYVGPDASHTIGRDTHIIDADGRVLSPGYIDSHTHIDKYWLTTEFLRYAMPGGTTSYITNLSSYGLAGRKGIEAFLSQIEDLPVDIRCLVPPLVSLSPAVRSRCIDHHGLAALLRDEKVIGIGESYWQELVNGDGARVLKLMETVEAAGKVIEGHGAGAVDKKLAAYTATGVGSCHEAITPGDLLQRLEMGLYAMVREGDIRRDLKILPPIIDTIDTRRVILVTDGTNPEALVRHGYFVDVLQKAVDMGLDPVRVVSMATLNPATYLGIDHQVGGLAPGRMGNILILPDLHRLRPEVVIAKGQVVAENGRAAVSLPSQPPRTFLLDTVRIPEVTAERLRTPQIGHDAMVRCLNIDAGGLVAREAICEAPALSGAFVQDPEHDLLKLAFMERVTGNGECFTGFIRGWGARKGAVATTLCWDACGVIAAGADDGDMALAMNTVARMRGGVAVAVDGTVLFSMPFPVAGYVSTLPMTDLAEGFGRFQALMKSLGSSLDFALRTLGTLTSAAIPFFRITEKGYYRFKERQTIGYRMDTSEPFRSTLP
ncbi:MAG: adenine deaminase C-terminal domain-containing protein [Desulfobacterales bacterium]